MQPITDIKGLKNSIALLQHEKYVLEDELKMQFIATFDSFKPMNLLKSSIKEMASSPDLKGRLINTAIGIGSGVISKRIFLGGSANPFAKIIGNLLEMGVAGVVSQNPDGIKTLALKLVSLLSRKKE